MLEELVALLRGLLMDVEGDGVVFGELALDGVEVKDVVLDDGDVDEVELLDVEVLEELVVLLLALLVDVEDDDVELGEPA